jgi:hypothetical protein
MADEAENREVGLNVRLPEAMAGGVWANFAGVSHSEHEFTIDFMRLDYSHVDADNQLDGIVVARVGVSPLFVRQLRPQPRRSIALKRRCRRRCTGIGDDIGNFATAVPDWSVGDEFFNSQHNVFRILSIATHEAFNSGGLDGAFVVAPVELAEP